MAQITTSCLRCFTKSAPLWQCLQGRGIRRRGQRAVQPCVFLSHHPAQQPGASSRGLKLRGEHSYFAEFPDNERCIAERDAAVPLRGGGGLSLVQSMFWLPQLY